MSKAELPKAGDVIGVRYRIESMLGQGGMGAVFSAVNQATERAVAIKWLLPSAARSSDAVARFLAEARATARIEHPNVIQVFDVGQDGEAPFLVMERLRGRSLGDHLEGRGRLSPTEALSILIPACRGVAEAHREGIVHRDLKPDNIFLCEGKDGSPRPPKVLDFGISKLQEAGGSITRTGIAMGTPHYMSPEQLNAPPEADPRFDVYAMGVVLYECLAGRLPFEGGGLFELVQMINAGEPPPLRSLAPEVSPELEAIVLRAMHVQGAMRHPSMEALISDLEGAWRQLSGGAPPPHVPILTGGAAAEPSTGAHTGPMGWHTPPPFGPPAGPSGPTYGATAAAPKRTRLWLILGGLAALAIVGVGLLIVLGAGAAFWVGQRASSGGSGSAFGGLTSDPNAPNIDVRFGGACQPSFDQRVMVTASAGTVNVMSSGMAGVTGSILLSVPRVGTIPLSTTGRMRDQTSVSVLVGQELWTNMASQAGAVYQGQQPDPISGQIEVRAYDANSGRVDVIFHRVTLQSTRSGSLCTLDGRLQTSGTTLGG